MRQMTYLIPCFLFVYCSQVFAVCEDQKEKYERIESYYHDCQLGANVQIAIAGLATWWAGCIGAPLMGLFHKPTMDDIERVRDNVKAQYEACLDQHRKYALWDVYQDSMTLKWKQIAFDAKENKTKQIKSEYETQVNLMVQSFVDEGFDINLPQVKDEIETRRLAIEKEFQTKKIRELKQLDDYYAMSGTAYGDWWVAEWKANPYTVK